MIRLTTEIQRDLTALLEGGDPVVIAERVRSLPSNHLAALLAALHPADSADLFEELHLDQQRAIIHELDSEDAAEMLSFMDSEDQAEVMTGLDPDEISDILDEMEPDDAADVLAELSEDHASAILAGMEDPAEVQSLLEYDEESAGGLMTSHVVTVRSTATVEQAIHMLRRLQLDEELAYYLFVTDVDGRLTGVLSLRQLVAADPHTPISQIMNPDVISISVDADQEEAAQLLSRYGLLILPTVDHAGRLMGVITADDVIDVLQEEATEDMYRLAGMDAEERMDQSVFSTARSRLSWLLLNLPTAMMVAAVVSQFEDTVHRVAALAAFMPIVAGMGGNAGIQTLTLIVRSIALGENKMRRAWRMLAREVFIGVVNGLCFGTAIALFGLLWKGIPILGMIAGLAMLANMIAGAVAGTLVPLTLRRIGADPALASGVIVTAMTDLTGYTCFLGLATLLINMFPVI
jgi:magnesium transporter